MGIILKGDKNKEENIHKSFAAACNKKEAKRAFGYLLYELAGLANLAAMEIRLDEIIARRNKIEVKPGMQKDKLPIDAKKLKETLTQTMEALVGGDYMETIKPRKTSNILNASNWTPSNATIAAETYLRNLMRKFAAQFIAESGGQS